VKKNLKETMDKVEYVATTTDCWSAHGRSFIGVTGHWIDPETLERKSCVLACRCLKGRHTYDVLASQLEDIHTEFQIRSKVSKTTTDNGSNFVKAFSVLLTKTKKIVMIQIQMKSVNLKMSLMT
jgi:hypothetical protein